MRADGRDTLAYWGRGLLVGGLVGLVLSAGPAALVAALPGDAGFIGVVAALLVLSVAPLMALTAGVGAILLLAATLRRWRERR